MSTWLPACFAIRSPNRREPTPGLSVYTSAVCGGPSLDPWRQVFAAGIIWFHRNTAETTVRFSRFAVLPEGAVTAGFWNKPVSRARPRSAGDSSRRHPRSYSHSRTVTVAHFTAQLLFPAIQLLLPAMRWAPVFPSCMPARVSFADCVLPLGHSPCGRPSRSPTTMSDKTPSRPPAVTRLPGRSMRNGCTRMHACPLCCSWLSPLRNGTNTRYGWVASPYPTGTSTRQEAPSFARRDNVQEGARGAPGPCSQDKPALQLASSFLQKYQSVHS